MRRVMSIAICLLMITSISTSFTQNVGQSQNIGQSISGQSLQGNTWIKMSPTISPPARYLHSMVYDSHHDKVILFGGYTSSGGYSNDTWAYDLNTDSWSNMNPVVRPSSRVAHAMVFDSQNNKVILFGGNFNYTNVIYGDTWVYDLITNTWTNMTPSTSPSARWGHSMTYDSRSGNVILFGGKTAKYAEGFNDETWTYNLSTNIWVNKNPTTKPSARNYHAMEYDSKSDKVILFGGCTSWSVKGINDETWTYDLDTNIWTNITPTLGPSARMGSAMAYNNQEDELLLFGGWKISELDDETWVFDPGTNTWTMVIPTISPSKRYHHDMVYNHQTGQIILFGGWISSGVNDDTWTYYAIETPTPSLEVDVTSHFSELNSAAQSSITVHVTDGTNPVQGATVNLDSDNGGIFSSQSGITDANGDFESILNAPTVTSQIICRISAEANKTGYNNGFGYVDITVNPIPWPMFRHNLNHTGLSSYDTSANNGQLKWSFATEGYIISSPAIGADGTIYVGSFDHKLYAINPDGTEKWNFKTGSFVDDSSPAIGSDGTIYIGSRDNKLYAINPDGTEKWNFTTGHDISSSPAIGADGTIYVGSNDDKLYAIYPDGTEKWSFTAGDVIRSSPAIGFDGTIYVGSGDHKLYSINSDGMEKWNFTTGFGVISSPAIGSDGTIYIGSSDKNLYAINPDGTEKWNFSTNGQLTSSPAIGSDGTIYIGSADDYIYAINPDGTEKWSFYTGLYHDVVSSPAIGFDGTIYIGSCSKKLHAVNPNGTEKWNFTTGSYIHSSPAIGTDGTIYIGSGDNNLYAIGGLAQKQPPDANAGLDQIANEADTIQFDGSASYDPDGTIEIYEWDFDISDGLWWETSALPDATGPTPTHTYGDDGVFAVTLRVTDNDNLTAIDTCNVTVQNVDPTVTIDSITMEVEIGLRVAGRKYNNFSMVLYENGSLLGYVSIERIPGSPDEQMAWIPVCINFSKSYNATVTYIPEDPPNVGANPVWIYIKSQNGSIKKIHHTFNVQQSKKRNSTHWNHVEPWEVDLNSYFIGLPFEITSHITDPGSDDETLTFIYGSQVKMVTYLNNPPNPDPYLSPEVNPVDIMDMTTLVFEGLGTVTLVVKDDDNIRLGVGEGTDSLVVG